MYDYETMGEELLGDDVLGDDDFATVGRAAPRLKLARRGAQLRLPARPAWRNQVAPGVGMPGQGLELLPLTPNLNGGVFTPAFPNIIWQARPQRPFRGERLVTRVVRSAGAGAVVVLCSSLFVGTSLQQAELGNFDLELFGPTAFGMRLSMIQAPPGVLISLPCLTNIAVPAGETVTVTIMILGHTIR